MDPNPPHHGDEAGAGVADASIKTVAKGESEPAEPRPDGTREPLNRRAEVQITIGR